MKRTFTVAVLVLAAIAAFADHHVDGLDAEALISMAPSLDGKALSEVTVNEILAVAEELSIREQEQAYVYKIAGASWMVPGAGQFKTGNVGEGVLQLGLHLGVVGGTLFGAYALLPQDLKDILDDKAALETYFSEFRFEELWQANAVLAGGMILDGLIRGWSSHSAARSARAAIDEGRVMFEPNLTFLGGHLGVGMRMHF
jgi:TM2 domain-containing membrane protein YozV